MDANQDKTSTGNLFAQIIFNLMLMSQWKQAHTVRRSDYNLSELFTLEIIGSFTKVINSELCKFLNLAPSSMSGITRKLCDNGLIKFLPSKDGRETPWELTPKGVSVLQQQKQVLASLPNDNISGLSADEIILLNQSLEKVYASQRCTITDLFSPIVG